MIFPQTAYDGASVSGLPCSGPVTSLWGVVDGPEHAKGHSGVDIAIAHGQIVANPAQAASVVRTIRKGSGWDAWYAVYGNSVVLEHGGYFSLYAHLSMILCHDGQTLALGAPVGYSGGIAGAEGSGLSTGPHLHWGLSTDSLFPRALTLDPLAFIAGVEESSSAFTAEDAITLYRYAVGGNGIAPGVTVTPLARSPQGNRVFNVEMP